MSLHTSDTGRSADGADAPSAGDADAPEAALDSDADSPEDTANEEARKRGARKLRTASQTGDAMRSLAVIKSQISDVFNVVGEGRDYVWDDIGAALTLPPHHWHYSHSHTAALLLRR